MNRVDLVADGDGTPPGMVAVRPGDLRHCGRGAVSALATAPAAGRAVVSGEPLAFCHQVPVAPAVVRRGGEVQAVGWLPDHVTLGVLEAHLPFGEIEELVENFGCAEERRRVGVQTHVQGQVRTIVQGFRRVAG